MEKLDEQPNWLDEIIGMESYGVKITDAYLADKTLYGKEYTVVGIESTSTHHRIGYWYYHDVHEQWYWSVGGGPKEVMRDALEIIKENFDPTD